MGLGRRIDLGFADDFDQRRAAPVQVDIAEAIGIGKSVMNRFAGILFQVDTLDPHPLGMAVLLEIEVSVFRQGFVELRNLVALGQIGIEVILACKNRKGIDAAIERQGSLDGHDDRLAIQHRQSSGKTQANRTGIGIGRGSELGRAAAEDLGSGQQLGVNLEANDGFIGHVGHGILWMRPMIGFCGLSAARV